MAWAALDSPDPLAYTLMVKEAHVIYDGMMNPARTALITDKDLRAMIRAAVFSGLAARVDEDAGTARATLPMGRDVLRAVLHPGGCWIATLTEGVFLAVSNGED